MKKTTARIRSSILSVYALYGCIVSCLYGVISLLPAFWNGGIEYEDQIAIAISMAVIFAGFIIAGLIKNSNIQSAIRFKQYAVHSSLNDDHIEEVGRSSFYAGNDWLGYAQGVQYRFWHRSEIKSIENAGMQETGRKLSKLKIVTKDNRQTILYYTEDTDINLPEELREWLYSREPYAEQMSMSFDDAEHKTETAKAQPHTYSHTFKIVAVILIAAVILLIFFLFIMRQRQGMPQQHNDGYLLYVLSLLRTHI